MVPQRRLATLLDQARQFQAQSCVYHSDTEPPSLYTDHECNPGQFPSVTTHILADHEDEVWRIEWSADGTMLASAGKDRKVVTWQLVVSRILFNGTLTAC
jgi:WD40 repeat protein